MGFPTRWAYGFHLGGQIPGSPVAPIMGKGSSLQTFGHFGQSSCLAWADPDKELVVAFTCSRLLHRLESRRRWVDLNNAIWEAVL
jgi:CubicO group peptidase (beta-lactamase class C family)